MRSPSTPPLRFTVVTPCRDAAERIGATARSVLGQTAIASGRVSLEYLILDGGSRDGTVEAARAACGDRAVIVSQPDEGMYDALARGLARATGDVVSYLNAGDVYSPTAFDVVADVLADPRIRWLTGLRVTCNDRLQVVEALLPYPYRRALLRRGLYGTVLPHVQQESTFWRRELLAGVDLGRLSTLRLAGDFYLWQCFARSADLVLVEAYLGGFTQHPGQLSEDRAGYWSELRALREPPRALDWLRARVDQRLWSLPAPWKKRLHPDRLVRWDPRRRRWE